MADRRQAPVRTRGLVVALLGVTAGLLIVNVAAKMAAGSSLDVPRVLALFDVNRESNVPTM